MRIRGTLIALIVVGLAALAGCSEDDPVPKMPKTSAAAPTPSPTTSPTPLSEAEEAEALIRRWAELDLEMQNTGETAAYSAITSEKCVSCRRVIRRVEALYANGGRVDAPGQRVLSVREAAPGESAYTARILVEPSRYRESPDDAWTEFDGGRTTNEFTLVRDGERLIIREIERLS